MSRTQSEIDEQVGRAYEAMDEGSKYPSMSYEEGVIAAIDWLNGNSDDEPMEEE